MPAHNAIGTLAETIESLQRQSHEDFEVVCVDDGSTDGTEDLLHQVAAVDARWRLFRHGRIGLVAALNQGLHRCRAPIVARMDADDVAHPDRLREQLAHFAKHPEVAIVGTQVQTFREVAGSPCAPQEGYARYDAWQNALVRHEDIAREIFVESPFAHPSVAFRRQAVLALGGYRDPGWPEDYDLWLRAHAAGVRFGKVSRVLLQWRDAEGRTSRVHQRYGQAAFLRCKAHYLARGPLGTDRRVVLWGAGPIGRRLGRYLAAEGIDIVAFVDIDPRKLGVSRLGAPTVEPSALPSLARERLVSAVGSRGAREVIRARAVAMGWQEGLNFWCAA